MPITPRLVQQSDESLLRATLIADGDTNNLLLKALQILTGRVGTFVGGSAIKESTGLIDLYQVTAGKTGYITSIHGGFHSSSGTQNGKLHITDDSDVIQQTIGYWTTLNGEGGKSFSINPIMPIKLASQYKLRIESVSNGKISMGFTGWEE